MNTPTVFISYCHNSPEHGDKVLAFSDKLRSEGINCILDQYETSPPEGWPRWMDNHIREADFVLLICTETYYRRVIGKEKPGKGLGVRWEGNLIYQHIYDDGATNKRFIPILFESGKTQHIPDPLRGATYYHVDTKQGYEELYRRLTDQPLTKKPKLGKLRKLSPKKRDKDYLKDHPEGPEKISLAKMPSTNPELFGRGKELEILDKAWDDPKTNILSLVAFGGVGKTALVSIWLKKVREDNWRGAERVLGWSFYSQGASEGRQVSADQFIAFALGWFGDDDPTKGSPWDKGQRLADHIKKQRTLLILDGLEPLQDPSPGRLGCINDPGLQTMLRELAVRNRGLCIITTRLDVDDLKEYTDKFVQPVTLEHLTPEAGAQLLERLGAEGTSEELEQASREFDGHALALMLLGSLVARRYKGDIRQRDRIPRLTIDKKKGGHARRVMESYEKWFKGKPELDILRMMGLFDRPAPGGAIAALRAKPAIKGLTKKIQKLSDEDWLDALDNLREVKLLSPEDPAEPDTLDCHPLVREHFGEKLENDNPEGWKEAHSRLYEYYKSVPEKKQPDTIEEMAPLYAAVGHGCQAGRHREALYEVFWLRISRGQEGFSIKKLGAFGLNLAAISGFFEIPWGKPTSQLTDDSKGFVLNEAGFCLRALGRLEEAMQLLQAGLEADEKREDWQNAAIAAGNFSGLHLAVGNLDQALKYGRDSVEFADRSGDQFQRMGKRTTVADALHQIGRMKEAEAKFHEAEKMQKARQPELPLLYSVQGFKYCDLLLSQGKYSEVQSQAEQTLKWAIEQAVDLHSFALDHLSLGHALLQQVVHEGQNDIAEAASHLNQAVDGLRQAGIQEFIVRGLLARTELYRMQREFEKAQRDVAEAMTMTTRGGMQPHEADCHLEYVRLYLAMGEKEKARENLEIAAGMIEEMGYHRRDPEVHLAYAKLFIAEENKDKAREHLGIAKKMIDEMGMHRWDREAEDLAGELG